MLNVITAKFCSGSNQTWTDEAYQYDYGQVLQFDGLELPDAYEVHFSNTPLTGETITQIGGANGVSVPDQFFLSGSAVYAWAYLHEGEDDGETVYMVTIPVKKRPQPSDDVPTPVEQSAIDQAIAALNIAVDKAEDAITHYPRIQDGTWWVWDVTTEAWVDTDVQAQGRPGTDGDDGFSPAITVTDITGGHRVTITDAIGTQTVDVMNGQPGAPGYSPTVTVTEITGGHRVTITDAQGSHVFDVMDGSDASVTVDDELSNTSENPVQNKIITGAVNQLNEDITELSGSIAPVESSTTATAAHAVGELFLVGETLMVALSAIAVGDTITTEGSTPNAAVTKLTDKLLKDVQVNGTSVVTDGVANVPLATNSTVGVMKPNTDRGLQMVGVNIGVMSPALSTVKKGSFNYQPVTIGIQDAATFYGLAKVAGADEKDSTLAVGTYTDAAKVAIQKMLGIYEAPWELIREDTFTNATEANHVITVDGNGQPFELTDVIFLFETPKQDTAAAKGTYGQIWFYDTTKSNFAIQPEMGAWTQEANAASHGCKVIIEQQGKMLFVQNTAQTTNSNNGNIRYRYMSTLSSQSDGIYYNPFNNDICIDKITIPAVTGTGHYRLFGKRAWS